MLCILDLIYMLEFLEALTFYVVKVLDLFNLMEIEHYRFTFIHFLVGTFMDVMYIIRYCPYFK